MPKWTLFAEMTHPVNMCMHAGRKKLPLSFPFSHFLLPSLFIVPFCGSGGRHAAYFALNAKAGIILMLDETINPVVKMRGSKITPRYKQLIKSIMCYRNLRCEEERDNDLTHRNKFS